MFAKFSNLPQPDKTDSSDAKDAAGHGRKSLDWHSLRAKLSAEHDLRSTLKGEQEALACWLRAEGSFDPRAAEALCCQHGERDEASHEAEGEIGDVERENFAGAQSRLPDPKPSRPISEQGCGQPKDGGGCASGTSVED